MNDQRKRYDTAFKARVALEALKEQKTIQQIATQYQIHPSQVTEWKRQLAERIGEVFERGRSSGETGFELERERLHSKIGELTVKLDFLEQKSTQLGL